MNDPISFFKKETINEGSWFFKWDLNKVPKDYTQVLILAELIKSQLNSKVEINIKPDKRKRAKGLPVVFVNKVFLTKTDTDAIDNIYDNDNIFLTELNNLKES
jgi:hypothetical protein